MKEALKFAQRGWFVFPVGQDKRPLIKGWPEEASMDEDKIRRWASKFKGCNWAVNCGRSGLIVVDVDSTKVPEAGPAYEALEFDYGLDPGLSVRTPSGGAHHYFAGVSKSGNSKLGHGIDIKSRGGYVLLPGSSIGGRKYEVVKDGTPTPPPKGFIALLETPTEKSVEHKEAENPDRPLDISTFAAELVEAEDPVEGTRNQATFGMAARAHDLGLSLPTALILMHQLWLPKLGEFSTDELERTVKSAFSSVQGEHGAMSAANAFDDPVNEEDMPGFVAKVDADDGPLHYSSFLSTPPEREWVLDSWVPLGEVTSLYGDGGIGKSLLAQQLGMAVATGGKFLDLQMALSLPTLGVFCEDTNEELHRRTWAISQTVDGAFAEDAPLLLWSRAQKDNALAKIDAGEIKKVYPFYKRLCAQLDIMGPGPKFLILDTLADLFDGNENDRGSANKFVKVILGRLVRKHNCTILLLAHPSAGNIQTTSGGRAGTSGSTAWNNAVRTRLFLRAHEKIEDCRVLARVKSNYAKKGEELFMSWNNGAFRKMDVVEAMAAGHETLKNLVMEAVANQALTGTPFGLHGSAKLCIYSSGLKDLEGKIIPKDTLKEVITAMVREGDLSVVTGQREGNGIWPVGGSKSCGPYCE